MTQVEISLFSDVERQDPWHAYRPQCSLLGGNAERRIGRPIAAIVATLDDLAEETFAVGLAVELEIVAALIAIEQDVSGSQPVGEFRFEPEASFEIVVVVRGNLQPPRSPSRYCPGPGGRSSASR